MNTKQRVKLQELLMWHAVKLVNLHYYSLFSFFLRETSHLSWELQMEIEVFHTDDITGAPVISQSDTVIAEPSFLPANLKVQGGAWPSRVWERVCWGKMSLSERGHWPAETSQLQSRPFVSSERSSSRGCCSHP